MAFDPDQYLAEKTASGQFNPDAYLNEVNPISKTESAVRGAAQGASMGFADEITGALESAVSDKSYEQARNESREAYKAAKEANPKTSIAGELGGAAATALIPGLGEATIPKLAAQGAMYGLGSSEADLTKGDVKEAAKDAAIGGAAGAIGGTIANKVITPAITKGIPALAKWATASIIPEKEALEAVTARLANPEEIKNALTKPEFVQKLTDVTNKALSKASDLSEAAQANLTPNKVTNVAELADIFKDVQSQFTTEGIPSGEAQEAAVAAINRWKGVIQKHLQANEGDLPDTTLAKLIRDMRRESSYRPLTATASDDLANKAVKVLNTRLDSILKESPGNETYKEAMIPVDDLMKGITKVEDLFGLIKEEAGRVSPGKMTESKVANVLGPNKTYTQEALGHLKNLTGEDLMKDLENSKLRNVFESGEKGGFGLQAWGTGLGATAGRLLPVPGGALAGGAVGGLAAHALEGGKIAAALIDKYLAARNSGMGGAIMKFGPLLADAAKRGGNALASTHFVLATSNPEYQKLIEETQNESK